MRRQAGSGCIVQAVCPLCRCMHVTPTTPQSTMHTGNCMETAEVWCGASPRANNACDLQRRDPLWFVFM